MPIRDAWQELRELGPSRTAFRAWWELRLRSGLLGRPGPPPPRLEDGGPAARDFVRRLPFADPASVADWLRGLLPAARLRELEVEARDAARGRILCFGRWQADAGVPPDWHRDPRSGLRWNAGAPWPRALEGAQAEADVKLTWEIARFPHAYAMARAAAHVPDLASECAHNLLAQMRSFTAANPYGSGLHWVSGQEIAVRLLAWIFALDTTLSRSGESAAAATLVADSILAGAAHVERHLEYARHAVYNNHLLAEALLLYAAGSLFPLAPRSRRWRRLGRALLEQEADRQFDRDGGYLMPSFNYQRGALQYLTWASILARAAGERPAAPWLAALSRAVGLLHAHQNPGDGRLPNFGANDGSLPSRLSSCEFADFRPTLQAASLLGRGERLFEPGPWDEEAAWFLGPRALDAPLHAATRVSVSFPVAGYHVLRGRDGGSFATLRCGTVRERFGQMDMLHADVWWRGCEVLADGGSYLYNGPPEWHAHFVSATSHNTLTIDGHDQMVQRRRFKVVHWTRARLLRFEDNGDWAAVAGEHYGFSRHPGGCVHRRALLFAKDDLVVVVDRVSGAGSHEVLLHWLCGDHPHAWDQETSVLRLTTPRGEFGLLTRSLGPEPAICDVARGQESPPRGWISRHYGERTPAPSLVARLAGAAPLTLISVAGAGTPCLTREGGRLLAEAGEARVRFGLSEGLFQDVRT